MPEIREVGVENMEQVARLWNAGFPLRPTDAEEMGRALGYEPHLRPRYWLAWQEDSPIGLGILEPNIGSYHPLKWLAFVTVDLSYRRQGLGQRLWETLLSAIPEPPISIQSGVTEDDEPSLRFASRRGFEEVKRDFESELDLGTTASLVAPDVDCITFATLEEMDSPAFRRQMHALFEVVRADIPRPDPPTPLTFEFYESEVIAHPKIVRNATVIGMQGEEIAGFSTVYQGAQDGYLDQGLTAVRRESRGKGLAQALKVRCINRAREAGYRAIRTDNDTRNAPMLAINDKLGFKRLKGTITMQWEPRS